MGYLRQGQTGAAEEFCHQVQKGWDSEAEGVDGQDCVADEL